MIIGCGLPLLLLFLAPVIGLSSNIAIFIFIIAMFACHLLMAKNITDMTLTSQINTNHRGEPMKKLNIKKLGLAFGSTTAILYLGCVLLMIIVGQEGTVAFFNTLLHGFDTSAIIRMDIPWWEAVMGIVQIFILGWLTGALVAAIYNVGSDPNIE